MERGNKKEMKASTKLFLAQMEQDLEDLPDQPIDYGQEENSDGDQGWAQYEKQLKNYKRQMKHFAKRKEPQTLEEVKELVVQIEETLQDINKKQFAEVWAFYEKQLEKSRKRVVELMPKKKRSQEEIDRKLKKLRKEKRTYKNIEELSNEEDVQEMLEDLRELIEEIPEEQKEFQEYIAFFREKEAKFTKMLQKFKKKKVKRLSEAQLEKLVKEHRRNVRNLKNFKKFEKEEEIREIIEEVEEYLESVPQGYPELQKYKESYHSEIEKLKEMLAEVSGTGRKKKKLTSEEILGKSKEQRVEMLKVQKSQKKRLMKYKEPVGKEEIKERLEELKEMLVELPEGYEEFDEHREFYQEQMQKLELAIKKIQEQGNSSKKKGKKRHIKGSDSETDEESKKQAGKKKVKKLPTESDDSEKDIKPQKEVKKEAPKPQKNPKWIADTDESEEEVVVAQKKPLQKKPSQKQNRKIVDSEESEEEVVKPKGRQVLLDSDSEEEKAAKKANKKRESRGSGMRKTQKKYNDASPSSDSQEYKRRPKQKSYHNITDDEEEQQLKKKRRPPIQSSDQDNRKSKPKQRIQDSEDEVAPLKKQPVQNKPKKNQRLNYDSESGEDNVPPKKKYKEEVKVPTGSSKFIRLECGHEFKKEELKREFENRTDRLIHTNEFDEMGEKVFKCLRCYHLITTEERQKIIGDKLDKQLQNAASERLMKLFDSAGNLKKVDKNYPVCLLCDAPGELEGNHDQHNFCKKCWRGVTAHYKKEVGCLVRDCTKFEQELNNTNVKGWINEAGIDDDEHRGPRNERGKQNYSPEPIIKGEGREKCQTCKSPFEKWKFESCEDDCDIQLCKKCTAKLYKEEQKDECISCYEIIQPTEFKAFLANYA